MKISFTPIRMDSVLVAELSAETLTLNGDAYDFSHVEEGQPVEDHDCPWVIGPVSRVNGELEVTLLLPHGGHPPHDTVFPQPIQVAGGAIPLPAYDAPVMDDHME